MQPSMSRKGNCWDNAVTESFWATLKTELVNHEHYATHDQTELQSLNTSKCFTIANVCTVR
jgi:transposase InsO family protein